MKTHRFFGNQYVSKWFSRMARKIWNWPWFINARIEAAGAAKRTIIAAAIICVFGWVVAAVVAYNMPQRVYAEVPVEVKVGIKFDDIPMLQRICNAEVTGNPNVKSHQFNRDGSVVRGKIDKSDIGYCQINERYNNDEARRLGYDIYTEEGNKAFAVYLFLNRGVQPWKASYEMWK